MIDKSRHRPIVGAPASDRYDRATLRPYRCRHCHQWHIAGGQIP